MAPPIHQIPVEHDEHDPNASAKRVVLASAKGKTVSYEDTNFISGDSPAVLDFNTDAGHNARDGYITNDGNGDIQVEISDDNGVTYGGTHTLKNGETLTLEGVSISRIRITWVQNSSYRVLCI